MTLEEAAQLLEVIGLPTNINRSVRESVTIANQRLLYVDSDRDILCSATSMISKSDAGQWEFYDNLFSIKLNSGWWHSSEDLNEIVDHAIAYYKTNNLFVLDPLILI